MKFDAPHTNEGSYLYRTQVESSSDVPFHNNGKNMSEGSPKQVVKKEAMESQGMSVTASTPIRQNKKGCVDQKKDVNKHTSPSNPQSKLSRLSASKEPPRLPEMIHTDILLKEMKWMQECFITEHKNKTKLFKGVALGGVKYLASRETRVQKFKEDEEKRLKLLARSVALNVREFWKVIETVVSQRCQSKLKAELREQKNVKQNELVVEASKFATAIAEGLKKWETGVDPLMIRTAHTPRFRQSSGTIIDDSIIEEDGDEIGSEGWSEQEAEDAALDAKLSEVSDDLNSEDELKALEAEADMDLETLMKKFRVHETVDIEVPSLSSSSPKKRSRSSPDMSPKSPSDSVDEDFQIPRKKKRLQQQTSPFPSKSSRMAVSSPSLSDNGSSSVREMRRQSRHKQNARSHHESLSTLQTPPPFNKKRLSQTTEEQLINSVKRKKKSKQQCHQGTKNDSNIQVLVPGMAPIPFLLRAKLRTYQHEGLTWLLTLNDNNANGILADEMGLGKTIQTIALLAYLACYRGIWGPHLVVAPSTVILNWETEFKRFFPGFKVLTYYGGKKEREKKRQGWSEPFNFNVCIVSYTLILADAHIFRRKAWYYMILDEAQNIKNHNTQKWQIMLNFNSQRRLLLTGTPLQNDLTELWSLMHFLMPTLFESHTDWKELFSDPLLKAIESNSVEQERDLVIRLHSILRPFLLRRLKKDVECQMPSKYEHVIRCHLTKRQRGLYDEFIESKNTKSTLESSDYFGLLNVLMQLRKICNHPDLLSPREVSTPFGSVSSICPLIVPSCCHLALHDNWALPPSLRLNKLSSASPLTSIVNSEISNFVIQSPNTFNNWDSRQPYLVRHGNAIDAHSALQNILHTTDRRPVRTHLEASSKKSRLKKNPTTSIHSSSIIDPSSQNTCSSCGPICQLLLTPPLDDGSSEYSLHSIVASPPAATSFYADTPFLSVNQSSQLDQRKVSPQFLEIPKDTSTNFLNYLRQLLQSSSSGYPPRIQDVILQGLIGSKSTYLNELNLCYHLSRMSPFESTHLSSLSQLSHLPHLSSKDSVGVDCCPILELLSQQTLQRYDRQFWLQRCRQLLRTASQTLLPRNGGTSLINLYRKALFDKASQFNADPKMNVPAEKALAAQWVHLTATAVGVIRRSINLEYLVEQPAFDDDPYLRVAGACWESSSEKNCQGPAICSNNNFFFGPRVRFLFQREMSLGRPLCLSVLRGTEEENLKLNPLEQYFNRFMELESLTPVPETIMERESQKLQKLICIHPQKVKALGPQFHLRGPGARCITESVVEGIRDVTDQISEAVDKFHSIDLMQRCLFPPKGALQDDCGKLIVLAELLHKLKAGGHKCILFTQMSKMLDILEGFINLNGFTYLRLDGSTKVEQRQRVVESFNTDARVFLFMSSTRAGGVGINLIGADTVIFYDTDWNPAMDRQAMDRCHRIGQTRDVHIYRLITEHSIEENILRKQLLKRMLDDVVVDQGKFTSQKMSDFIDKKDVKEMFFSEIDASDLYTTRTLHERQSDEFLIHQRGQQTQNDSAEAFEAAIAKIEDLDDQLALEQTSLEKTLETVEFEKEFEEDITVGFSPIENPTNKKNQLAVLGQAIITNQLDTRKWTKPAEEDIPFWMRSGLEGDSSTRAEIILDQDSRVFVSAVVQFAIDFTEKNLPNAVLADMSALQERLDYFRSVYKQT